MSHITSSLFINALELNVFLGWPDKERARKQVVLLDVAIVFAKIPKACETDHLSQTICYSDLIATINKKMATKKFRLLEHLAANIHKIIKNSLSHKAKIHVSVTKDPKIKNLNGGVTFHYGDKQ